MSGRTERTELTVHTIDGDGASEWETCCRRCGEPVNMMRHKDGYRVVSASVTPRSPFALGMASLTVCPNRNCRQQFPELIDASQMAGLFDR